MHALAMEGEKAMPSAHVTYRSLNASVCDVKIPALMSRLTKIVMLI